MFNNSLNLIRFILQREKVRLSIWLISIISFVVLMPFAFNNLYGTEAEREMAVLTMSNPAMIALVGPNFGDSSLGAIFTQEMLLFTIIIVAIMNIGFVIRHTRSDEELGRLELVRSLPVGRLAQLSGVLTSTVLINGLMAVIIGMGLYLTGIESFDLNGSLLFGAILGVSGIFFGVATAFFAQLSHTARGAVGYTYTFLIVIYLLRAIGDVSIEALSYVSSLGLLSRTEVFITNRVWPLAIVGIQSLCLVLLACGLNAKRDLGAGLIPLKPGPTSASIFLTGSIGLAWRLVKNTMFAWGIAVFLMGLSFGAILGELEKFIASNEVLQMMFDLEAGNPFVEQITGYLILMMIVISTIPVVQVVLRLRSEEVNQLMESLFARAVSRRQVMGSYLFIATFMSGILCLLLGLGLWLSGQLVMDDSISLLTFVNATLIYLPAKLGVIGLALFLTGLFPTKANFTWIYLGYCFFIAYFGQLLSLNDFFIYLSIFEHIPALPLAEINWNEISFMMLLVILLTLFGFISYEKRDIQG